MADVPKARAGAVFEMEWIGPQSLCRSRLARSVFLTVAIFVSLLLIDLEYYGTALNGYHSGDNCDYESCQDLEPELETQSMGRAGNTTLGFHKILFLNLKKRYDRTDAATLQAFLSGIDFEEYPAVEPDMLSDVGMPPTHRPSVLSNGEHGCWRAHANVWSQVVRKKLPPVLIFESDATWDINIRPIMSNMNKYFVEFLRQINSTVIPNPRFGWKPKVAKQPLNPVTNATEEMPATIEYDPEDPWLSEHWDLLSLGHCFEIGDADVNMIFPDPHAQPGKDYYGYKLGNERVIRKSGGITCTTSYAISQTGAAKLLLRSSVDLDNPVDLLIRRMTLSGDLIAYSVMPTIVAQWEYADDIGMDLRGAQSDIRGGEQVPIDKDTPMPGWSDVKEKKSVWITKSNHPEVAFQNMGLTVAWEKILGSSRLENSQYSEVDGD